MRYYIIAGEASGDLHASNLMKGIRKKDSHAQFRCWGGDLMEKEGGVLVKHYRDLAFMGFTEVLANIRIILKNIRLCKKDILAYNPDAVILVDYPGFNLRIAEFAKKNGFKIAYYISPQVWAWKQNRVHQIKKVVDKMLVILPFEKDFYKKFDFEVDYVGHPLIDAIHYMAEGQNPDFFINAHKLGNKPIIAVLPGSRKQEVSKMLKVMLGIRKNYPDHQFVIAAAPSLSHDFFTPFLTDDVKIVYNRTYDLLRCADAALVTSGTATLETALFEVPEVVCYSGGYLSYLIAKKLIKVKYISLVNLIMDKKVVTELIQDDFNEERLKQELNQILFDSQIKEDMLRDFQTLKDILGGEGASEKAAGIIHCLALGKN
jgi:lipid-A-disaccharide synthase